jgi:hypothetical protein
MPLQVNVNVSLDSTVLTKAELVVSMASNFVLVLLMQPNVSIVFQAQLTGSEVANDARPTSSYSLPKMPAWLNVQQDGQRTVNQNEHVIAMVM